MEAVGEIEEQSDHDDRDECQAHPTQLRFLTTMLPITFAAVSAASIAPSSASKMSFHRITISRSIRSSRNSDAIASRRTGHPRPRAS